MSSKRNHGGRHMSHNKRREHQNLNMTQTTNNTSQIYLALHLKSESPEVYDFNVIIYGYILPSIALLIITVNIIMIAVFARGNFRSASHVVLICLATANILQVISITVPSIYFYGLGFAEEYVPYAWCALRNLLLTCIPNICSTLARLLTAILSIQRVIIVSFPITARSILKVRHTIVIVTLLLGLSVLLNLKTLLGYSDIEKVFLNSTVTPGKEVTGCIWQRTSDFDDKGIANDIVMVFIPVAVMLVSTILINYSLIKNKISRQKTMDQRIRRMVVITTIIVAVVIIDSLLKVFFKYSSFGAEESPSSFFAKRNEYYQGFMKCIRFLTFAANFMIYSLLSRQFRDSLKCLICCQINDHSKTQITYHAER